MRRILCLLVLFLSFAGVVAYEMHAARLAAPPTHVTTLNSFLQWLPGTHPAAVRQFRGSEYLIIFGPLNGFVSSGPPAYVFDKSGQFVEWVPDSGDDSNFERRWQPAGPRIDVDRQFAQAWIEKHE